MSKTNTIENWLQSKSNDPKVNMCCNPTSNTEALDILKSHFLGDDWYVIWPYPQDQANTEIVGAIIKNYPSMKFIRYPLWKRIYLRIYCFYTDTPLYHYY